MAQSCAASNHSLGFVSREQPPHSAPPAPPELNVFPVNSHYLLSESQCCRCSFSMVVSGKKTPQYYLLLVWAAQSMFHIVANRNSAPRAVSSRPSRGWRACGVRPWPPAGCAEVAPCPPASNNLLQSLSPTRGAGVRSKGRARDLRCPAQPKLATMEFYFRVILFTWDLHYTRCECTLYLFVVGGAVAGRERREARSALSLTNMGGVGMMTGC